MTDPEQPRRPRRTRDIDREVSREMARIQEEHPREAIERLDNNRRRCRVCHDVDALRRVNRMLTVGLRPAEIVENLADINARKRKRDKIGYWSVYGHRRDHFAVQETVSEGYRRILERRSQEEGQLLAEGVGGLLTLRGYLEIIANKGFSKLVDESTEVGYTIGLDAQRELEQLLKGDKDQAERAEMRRKVALIQQAIADTVSETEMAAISHRLDVLLGNVSEDEEDDDIIDAEVVDAPTDEYDDDEEVADFVMDVDDDDELGGP